MARGVTPEEATAEPSQDTSETPQVARSLYRSLETLDTSGYGDAKVEVDHDSIRVEAATQVEAKSVASTLLAKAGGEFEMTADYPINDETAWLVAVRRKES